MKSYIEAMRHYLDFSGRMSRARYWIFQLAVLFVLVAVVIVGTNTTGGDSPFGSFVSLVLAAIVMGHVIPTLSAQVRRLHDSDKSGWTMLLNLVPFGAIVVFVFYCLPSTPGINRFGANPADFDAGAQATPEELSALQSAAVIDENTVREMKARAEGTSPRPWS